MGKAIIIPDVSYATNNLGRVTFAGTVLRAISIVGADNIGGVSTYTIAYTPTTAEHKGVTWSVVSGAATITQEGVLTPTENGTVVIQAVSTYDQTIVATKTITVSIEIPVESISIVGDSLISGQGTYSIAYNPSNTTQHGVTWSVVSGNATITQQGVLTASDNGEVVIQAVSTYNSQVVATKTVTVSMVIPLVSLSIVGDAEIDGETTYSVAYNPSNTTETGVTWEVVSGSATITQGGVLTPSADGEIVIRATSTANQSISASKTVTMDSAHHYERDYFTIESLEDGNEIKIHNSQSSYNPTVYFSVDDGDTWDSVDIGRDTTVTVVTANRGDKVLLKQSKHWAWGSAGGAGNSFQTSKQFKVYGNIMSLIYGDNFIGQTTFRGSNTNNFQRLFSECTGLTDAENLILPATELRQECYRAMFYGCTSLTNVPNLPATTLGSSCYREMFYGCSSITSVPQNLLPATTLADSCYRQMFDRCSLLTNVPNLPAMTLTNDCYRAMFNMCASLTSVPANLLPATTLADSCYKYMFCDCANIVEAPVLPAPTLVASCYNYMFGYDSNLGNLNFKLASITCLATDISATNALTKWVFWDGAQSSIANGTFTKAAGVTWPTGVNGIPTGWTVQDYVEPSNNE